MNNQDIINEIKHIEEKLMEFRYTLKRIIKELNKNEDVGGEGK
jgi:hypothetical protein